MILDAHNQYDDAHAYTATAASTNYIDHGSDRNLGVGEPMGVLITLDVAADDTTGDETYSVAFQVDDNTSFSSATTLGTITITRGDAAGSKYVLAVPKDANFERYSRLYSTLGGTTPTVTMTAVLLPLSAIEHVDHYADGITIS